MVTLGMCLWRTEERRIVALVEARPATGMGARHRVLDRGNVAVSALLISKRHDGAGSADSSLVPGEGNVKIHKAANLMGSRIFLILHWKAS